MLTGSLSKGFSHNSLQSKALLYFSRTSSLGLYSSGFIADRKTTD